MVARSLMLGASMLSGASALLPLSGYLRQPVPYSAASVDELRKQNDMRMQDSGLELETDDSPDESPVPDPPKFDPKTMPGVTGPLGFFDPLSFSAEASEGKVRFLPRGRSLTPSPTPTLLLTLLPTIILRCASTAKSS